MRAITKEIYLNVNAYIRQYIPLKYKNICDGLIARCKRNEKLSEKVFNYLNSLGVVKPLKMRWYVN